MISGFVLFLKFLSFHCISSSRFYDLFSLIFCFWNIGISVWKIILDRRGKSFVFSLFLFYNIFYPFSLFCFLLILVLELLTCVRDYRRQNAVSASGVCYELSKEREACSVFVVFSFLLFLLFCPGQICSLSTTALHFFFLQGWTPCLRFSLLSVRQCLCRKTSFPILLPLSALLYFSLSFNIHLD